VDGIWIRAESAGAPGLIFRAIGARGRLANPVARAMIIPQHSQSTGLGLGSKAQTRANGNSALLRCGGILQNPSPAPYHSDRLM